MSAPASPTSNTLPFSPAPVNGAGESAERSAARKVVTGRFCFVDGASVSLLRGGDYHLLLRTSEGQVQFIVPAHLAHEFLRLTNPPALKPRANLIG